MIDQLTKIGAKEEEDLTKEDYEVMRVFIGSLQSLEQLQFLINLTELQGAEVALDYYGQHILKNKFK